MVLLLVAVVPRAPLFEAGGDAPTTTVLDGGKFGRGAAMVCVDLAAYDKLDQAAAESGADERGEFRGRAIRLERDGQLFVVSGRPEVKVLGENGRRSHIEMLEGKHAGRSGWVSTPWLVRR